MTDLRLNVEPVTAPSRARAIDLEQLTGHVLAHAAVRESLNGRRHRILSLVLLDPEDKTEKPSPPDAYRTVIYDYEDNRAIIATGLLSQPEFLKVSESTIQPLPSAEEFDAAVAILQDDPKFGPHSRKAGFGPTGRCLRSSQTPIASLQSGSSRARA